MSLEIERIKQLCMHYEKHLTEHNKHISYFELVKRDITKELLKHADNPKKLISLLDEPSNFLDFPTRTKAEVLQMNRNSSVSWFFKGLFLLITAPVSLPLLLLWSFKTRGTLNFFKADGAIFLEHLIPLCQSWNELPPDSSEGQMANIFDPEITLERKSMRFRGQAMIIASDPIQRTDNPNQLRLRFTCESMYTDAMSEPCEITLFKTFSPMSTDKALPQLLITDTTNKEQQPIDNPWIQSGQAYCLSFFKDDFISMMKKGHEEQNADGLKAIEYYEQALTLANTDSEKFMVIEHLVNFTTLKQPSLEFAGLAHIVLCLQKKIDAALIQLPPDYRLLSQEVKNIIPLYQTIWTYLENNQINVAWKLFKTITLSDFLKKTCPDIDAMHFQLAAVFQINGEDIQLDDGAISAVAWLHGAYRRLSQQNYSLCLMTEYKASRGAEPGKLYLQESQNGPLHYVIRNEDNTADLIGTITLDELIINGIRMGYCPGCSQDFLDNLEMSIPRIIATLADKGHALQPRTPEAKFMREHAIQAMGKIQLLAIKAWNTIPYLEIQNDNNSFLSAVVFATLFPVLHDDDLFVTRFEALFGPSKLSKFMPLNKALLAYSPEHTEPPSLNLLINEQLRPRLAKHLTDNRRSLLSFFNSSEIMDEECNAIQTGAAIHNIQATASILSAWLVCTIRVYNNPEQTDFIDYTQVENATDTIALLHAGSQFHSLIDAEKLSPELISQLHPCLKKSAAAPSAASVRSELIATLYNEHVNRCQAMILNVLSKAGKISHSVPTRTVEFIDPFRTPYLTQTEGRVLRLNALPEIHSAQQLVSSDRIKLLPSQPIGSGAFWSISMAKSAAVSALISTGRFDISALVTMISMGTIELGSLVLASLPFLIGFMVTSLGVSAMDKHYPIELEKAIRFAKSHIDTGNYFEAMKCMDVEFFRWFDADASRYSFLTKEHYALAHFLRGTCALYNDERQDLKNVYDDYERAALDAKSANHLSLLMITQLQKIVLLKQDFVHLAPKDRSHSEMIDEIIVELTELMPDAFTDLYWKFNDKIEHISQRLLNPSPWDASEISIMNQYLIADGAFMLKHFAKGRGQFMEVYFLFFQSMVLAAIHQINWEYLRKSATRELKIQLKLSLSEIPSEQEAPALYFAVQKLRQCAEQLRAFKQQHPKLVADPDIFLCITRIKTFAKGLLVQTSKSSQLQPIDIDLRHVNQLLGTSKEEINQYLGYVDASIMFLSDLALDFNQQPFQTIDDLLDAIMAPRSSMVDCVSSKTGDTMLHRLATLPLAPELKCRVQEAAKRLKASAAAKNHRNETPVCLLSSYGDPHGLLAIIDAEPMIQLGDDFNYPERIESVILSRFTSKIEFPRLSAETLGKPIKASLLDPNTTYIQQNRHSLFPAAIPTGSVQVSVFGVSPS